MDNFDLKKYLAEGRLLKEDKPAGYYNAATITSHSDYYDIIITNKEEFFKIQKDPDSFMGEEAEEYLVDLEPGMYQMIYWNDEGPDSMGFDSKLDYVKESIRNYWGEDHFEEKFGIEDILNAAGDNWESAFHKHIEDNLDKYYEELNSLIKNSYPDKDSASGVVLLVNGKEVAGADNGRLTNMLGTADEIKRDMLREDDSMEKFDGTYYADFQDIGQAYLENMGKPHKLTNDELENLGKKIVNRLYKGDVGKAYDEIVMYDPRKLKR